MLVASRLGPWFTLGIAVALTTILVAAVGTGRLQSRLENKNPHAPGVEERHQLNLSSWAMFKQHPLIGWGLGTWADAYPAYARFTDTAVFAFAHNDYLQLLMETGVAGALCALVFWLVWGWMFLERMRRWPARVGASAAAPLAVAAALACLGILVHSWVDYNLHIPANLMLFFALAGMV